MRAGGSVDYVSRMDPDLYLANKCSNNNNLDVISEYDILFKFFSMIFCAICTK